MDKEKMNTNKESNNSKTSSGEQDWKGRFNDLLQSCQSELKRTTQIGMKMLSASQSNVQLHEAYEELGRLAKEALAAKELNWENARASELCESIQKLELELEGLEEEVQNIKKN